MEFDDVESETRRCLREADSEDRRITKMRGGHRVRCGETTVLLALGPQNEEGGSILGLTKVVIDHYRRLLVHTRGQYMVAVGHGVWRELTAPDGRSMAVQSFLEWRSMPGAERAIETTIQDYGQCVVTRLLPIAAAGSDRVEGWLDVSDIVRLQRKI